MSLDLQSCSDQCVVGIVVFIIMCEYINFIQRNIYVAHVQLNEMLHVAE